MGVSPNIIRADIALSLANFAAGTPTITLSSGNIKLGYVPLSATNTVHSGLSATAPYMVIGESSRERGFSLEDITTYQVSYRIKARIWFGLPQNTAQTFEQIEVFMSALCAQLEAGTSMTGSWNKMPLVRYEFDGIDSGKTPAICSYLLDIAAWGC